MEILIVDDEVMVVTLIKKHVDWEKIGVTAVRTAYNAQSAKRRVQENNIDLIICDIEMPQENGLVFLGWVKEHYPEISTIILTAFREFHYAQTAISLGAKADQLCRIVRNSERNGRGDHRAEKSDAGV